MTGSPTAGPDPGTSICRYSRAGSGSPGRAAERSHAAAPPCGSPASSKRLRMRAGSMTRSRPAKVARWRACSAAVPGSTVSSRGPRPPSHPCCRHLPRAGQCRERVAAVEIRDQPSRHDEVLGIGERRHGVAPLVIRNTGKPGAISSSRSSGEAASTPSKNRPTSQAHTRRYSRRIGGFSASRTSTAWNSSTLPSFAKPPAARDAKIAHPLGLTARRHEVALAADPQRVDRASRATLPSSGRARRAPGCRRARRLGG